MVLLENPDTTRRVRDNIGTNPEVYPILFRFDRQNINVEPGPIQVFTRDTSTDTIWDRDNWDEENWEGDYDNARVLVGVVNAGNVFHERFRRTDFNDTGTTTATWDTALFKISFLVGQIAQSKPIALNSETYSNATMTLEGSSLSNLTLKLSGDGGTSFETVSNGVNKIFTAPTTAGIKFKLEATGGSAEVTYIKVEYGV